MRQKIEKVGKTVRNSLSTKNTKYKRVFHTNEGEYVLAEIYKFCGVDRPSYVEGSPDRTAYNEGMKRVALHIKGVLRQSNSDIEKLVTNYQESINYDPFN